ncbi:MAG: response regulator [Patescibacteria group bacterium]
MLQKILFIEDEEALRRALGDVLSQSGYEMLTASNGEAGVEVAKKQSPDLILLDLVLPKKSGFEVLQELKEDPTTKNIPIIVLTNLEGSEDIERALVSGATTYLVKANYSAHDVALKIKQVLDRSS